MYKKLFHVIILILLCFGSYCFVFGYNYYLNFSSIVYPFLVIQKKLTDPISNLYKRYHDYKNLCIKLKEYKKENRNLKSDLIKYKYFFTFYSQTKDLADIAKKYNYYEKSVLSSVLLKNFDQKSHFFLVDAGKNKHIKPDMVVVYKNAIIGKVSEVYSYYSKVILITDKTCRISAFCHKSKIQAIHEGANRTDITSLSFVDHLQNPLLNDLVLSSGQGIIFPKGFALGNIKSITSKGLYFDIDVEPIYNLSDIKYCYLISQ